VQDSSAVRLTEPVSDCLEQREYPKEIGCVRFLVTVGTGWAIRTAETPP
jgi:hypothetical protein